MFDRQLSPQDWRGVSRSPDMHANSTHRAFRAATAALLLVISIVHLHLWFDGYRYLNTIGPLFLVAAISAALLAIIVAVRLNAAVATAAASFAAGTLVANILSLLLPDGIFRFKEVGVSYSGGLAIAAEIGVVALLVIWAYRHFFGQDQEPAGPRWSAEFANPPFEPRTAWMFRHASNPPLPGLSNRTNSERTIR